MLAQIDLPLRKLLTDANAIIEQLQKGMDQSTEVGDQLIPQFRMIGDVKYEVLTGENAGFLRGQEEGLYLRDDMAHRDYTLLREKSHFVFKEAVSDEYVEGMDGQKRVVVERGTAGGQTKQTLVERSEAVRDGDKEYTIFDVTKCFYI